MVIIVEQIIHHEFTGSILSRCAGGMPTGRYSLSCAFTQMHIHGHIDRLNPHISRQTGHFHNDHGFPPSYSIDSDVKLLDALHGITGSDV